VRPDGRKEHAAIGDGHRESKASWRELLPELKARGSQAGPLLAVGDGAFKLIEAAEKTWRRISGPEQIKLLLEGTAFRDGESVQDDQPGQQKLAA
jgi:hypothetical protein